MLERLMSAHTHPARSFHPPLSPNILVVVAVARSLDMDGRLDARRCESRLAAAAAAAAATASGRQQWARGRMRPERPPPRINELRLALLILGLPWVDIDRVWVVEQRSTPPPHFLVIIPGKTFCGVFSIFRLVHSQPLEVFTVPVCIWHARP